MSSRPPSSPRRPLTNDELQQHFEEQLRFLEASAKSFDDGFEGEAKRLATTLRVLLHDNPNGSSRSLLVQLGRQGVDFVDSALPLPPGNMNTLSALAMLAWESKGPRYVAMLDGVPFVRSTPFDAWWSALVVGDKQGRTLSRKDLVTVAANQDGGAHIDPALDEVYDALAHQNSLGWQVSGEHPAPPAGSPELAAIRQIAHEVLKTLKPGYHAVSRHETSPVFGGMSLGPAMTLPSAGAVGHPTKLGRNALCYCGSGKKFKKCHGVGA